MGTKIIALLRIFQNFSFWKIYFRLNGKTGLPDSFFKTFSKTNRVLEKALLLIFFSLLSGSCHLFENTGETENVAVYFNESNVSVYEGGLGSLSLRIEPPDGLPYYTVDYEILNEEIAAIFRADRRGVVFSGRKKGSTVISAKIGNAEAKAVINVFE